MDNAIFENCPLCVLRDKELTTLRQRLAEVTADRDACLSAARQYREHAEAEKARLVSAMTAENLRVAADAARWEGAARVLKAECFRHRNDRIERGVRGMSIEMMATNANATASALVREGGGGTA